ncbi:MULTISPECIES: phosphatidylglycerophosphatase A [unclassified Paenibacillus]|uniref:phosphatidylglycerophosphatase A family protein n=1 Tax=unclassified Paenibacillus TaxID=185978 RepID=UPI001AE76109|nr:MULTISPECIES: phosphatidylglycerophosphatase A [unclassified Paenibacillus]MBP1156206.1 phosphatidylglycerophosphatase A [Paenibacillus sp. PvP091]MBP1168408.1 phosphatidylglycerophosphatase A [Paenibacillus sp. PvR098]MBP2439436.1 phosphatidylglycerophosphatase A [Paenibacillus sp. PvP052]
MKRQVHSNEVKAAVYQKLEERGVTIEDIALIVREMQLPYDPGLTLQSCTESVHAVLQKRELQHAILVGIELDVLAEKGLLSEPLLSIVRSDEGLFGCDETLALGSVFGYGSIAVTTFGHLDKHKIGIIQRLDTKAGFGVHTFLDDLVASIAASASSRIAHHKRDADERENVVPYVPKADSEEQVS